MGLLKIFIIVDNDDFTFQQHTAELKACSPSEALQNKLQEFQVCLHHSAVTVERVAAQRDKSDFPLIINTWKKKKM